MLAPINSGPIMIPVTPGRRMAYQPISGDEYSLVKEAIPYGDVNARLYFELLRNTGCRASEIKRITPAHIGQNGPEVWVETYRGKTREKEPYYVRFWLNPTLGQQLVSYVRGQGLKPGELIFPRTHQRFWQIWSKASMQAIGRHAKIHDIRHVYITHLRDKEHLSLAQIAAMVGHKDLKVTMSHYNQMDELERRDIGLRMPA